MTNMNPDIKAQWVAALRSGEYKQGQNQLRTGDTYCCLGVLCYLAERAGVIEPPEERYGGEYHYSLDIGGTESTLLPPVVAEWAGLSSNPAADGNPLTVYNDGYADISPRPFSEIADLIEEHL